MEEKRLKLQPDAGIFHVRTLQSDSKTQVLTLQGFDDLFEFFFRLS